MEFYIRKLAKLGVKLIAITQDVGNEPYSQMIRQMLALFDEHRSRENGKHTKRAMQENARRGNHNGRPPFGYRHEGTGEVGNKGREKKRLVREESEVPAVQRIYDLYLNGIDGHAVGMSAIAVHLNARKMLRQGLPWRIQTVSQALSNPVYMGEYLWNLRSGKDRKRNSEDEVIRRAVPAIVSEETFKAVEARRRARRPSAAPARRLASPYLLSGLLTCGCCGSGMVASTGTGKGRPSISARPSIFGRLSRPRGRGFWTGIRLREVLPGAPATRCDCRSGSDHLTRPQVGPGCRHRRNEPRRPRCS